MGNFSFSSFNFLKFTLNESKFTYLTLHEQNNMYSEDGEPKLYIKHDN